MKKFFVGDDAYERHWVTVDDVNHVVTVDASDYEKETKMKKARDLSILASFRREISLRTKTVKSKKTYSRKIKHRARAQA